MVCMYETTTYTVLVLLDHLLCVGESIIDEFAKIDKNPNRDSISITKLPLQAGLKEIYSRISRVRKVRSLRSRFQISDNQLEQPSRLCHSHIHLDKCYLLDRCDLVTG